MRAALADDRAAQPQGLDRAEEGRRQARSRATGARTRCRSPTCASNPENLALLEKWLKSYRPQELFDANGRLVDELRALAPQGTPAHEREPARERRPAATAAAAAGFPRLRRRREEARAARRPRTRAGSGEFLRDILKLNPDNFRVFGPDETTSNKLDAVYEASKKTWLADYLPVDADGGELAPDGRVMEMLSEHTLEGWLEGYLLTGRHGFFSTYEAFVHVIDSMFNQHAKWLDISRKLPWRAPVASLNMLITSTVWRQDHNGFTHQDPGFLDIVVNKSPEVTRIYLPPDSNCLLAVADHCLQSTDDVNVIVCDKQKHLQYLDMDAAIKHCEKGIGLWDWASNDAGSVPDVVMVGCGDIATQEALAATALLRHHFPDLKLRFVNVVDLYTLTPSKEHPHGLSDRDFDSLFTLDRPVIFNFHGYPWLIHRLAYRRHNHANLHVRGYKEKGNINTPLELAIDNEADRFSLAIDVIDRVPRLQVAGRTRQGKPAQPADRVPQLRARARHRPTLRPRLEVAPMSAEVQASAATSQLEALRRHSVIVADTGDIDAIAQFRPQDATTNPSLIFKAAQDPRYRHLIDAAVEAAPGRDDDRDRVAAIGDRLFVDFGREILKLIPGRVSTEVDARLSFDSEATEAQGAPPHRSLRTGRRPARARADQDREHVGRHPRGRAARTRRHPLQPDAAVQLRAGGRVRRCRRHADFAVRRPHLRLASEGPRRRRHPARGRPGRGVGHPDLSTTTRSSATTRRSWARASARRRRSSTSPAVTCSRSARTCCRSSRRRRATCPGGSASRRREASDVAQRRRSTRRCSAGCTTRTRWRPRSWRKASARSTPMLASSRRCCRRGSPRLEIGSSLPPSRRALESQRPDLATHVRGDFGRGA